jgi:hypothetical protein
MLAGRSLVIDEAATHELSYLFPLSRAFPPFVNFSSTLDLTAHAA